MAKSVSLKPDFKLLNPDFDGYKLSTDADVTVYSQTLESHEGLEKRQTNSSYLHTRLDALHNHLFEDPFNLSFVYYFSSKGHLVKHSYSKDSRLSSSEVVWQAELSGVVGNEDYEKLDKLHYFATVCFPTSELAVVGNGQGSLHVLETGDRSTTQSWLECHEQTTQPGILLQARLVEGATHDRYLHCLVLSVTAVHTLLNDDQYVVLDEKLKTTKSSAVHMINWVVMMYNGATWEMKRKRTIAGEGTVEYCSLDESTKGILLLCHKNYSYVLDSEIPITKPKTEGNEEKKSTPTFTFLQTSDDINIWLNIGTTNKCDLNVQIKVQELIISIKDKVILSGKLSNPIHPDDATWTISDGKLEIVLPKASEGLNWTEFFQPGDPVGEELLDPQLVEEVNQRLAHLTSDRFNANPDPDKPAYNPGQFEACDEASEDLILLRLDGSTHDLSNMALLGPTQHLFNCQVQGNAVPAFCIRHDVDGILWQPEGEERFTHTATFNAFGYVKASKTMAKFTCAAPDNSYVAVADVKSHIYVFFQPEAFEGELRNRKSGKRMNTVARQVVISMKTHDEILGLHASPNVLFVLTEKTILAYCLRNR